MNDKYMTLFSKTDSQLGKELRRRGIKANVTNNFKGPENGKISNRFYTDFSRERAIAEIIYKDAHDAGRSLKAKEVGEEKTYDFLITDEQYNNMNWKVSLTASQHKLLIWLSEQDLLRDVDFKSFEEKNYEDVGRI